MRKLIFLSLVFVLGLSLTTFAAIPRLINYQGRLTDSSDTPLEGSHDITFRIYDAEGGGALLWEETQSVLIQKGVFSILLGGTTDLNLAFDKPYWLAIKVGSDSEMTPRQQIASSGYAIRAERADLALNAETADMADDTQKIAGKSLGALSASDNGKILKYNHSQSKFEYIPYLKMKTGTYTGNGTSTQTITGVGFKPKYAMVGRKGGGYVNPTSMFLKVDNMDSAYSVFLNGNQGGHNLTYLAQSDQGGNNMGAITALTSDGFTVSSANTDGSGANVSGYAYWYICFGE